MGDVAVESLPAPPSRGGCEFRIAETSEDGEIIETGASRSVTPPVHSCLRRLNSHHESFKRQVSFSDLPRYGETYEKYTNYFSEYDRTPRYRRGKRLTEADRRAILAEVICLLIFACMYLYKYPYM